MNGAYAELDGLHEFGNTAAVVAEQILGAGSFDLAKNVAALTPVFGAIGADFLAAYAVAQANHAKSVAELGGHFAATAASAHATAAQYRAADDSTATALGAAGVRA